MKYRAHDGPDARAEIGKNLRQAKRKVGRSCRVQADLAGPKLRTGCIRPSRRVTKLKPTRDVLRPSHGAGRVWLTVGTLTDGPPEDVRYALHFEGDLIANCWVGDEIGFIGTRGQAHERRVFDAPSGALLGEIKRAAHIRSRQFSCLCRARHKHEGSHDPTYVKLSQ